MEPVACSGTCTVTISVESAPLTEEKAQDLLVMFWAFVLLLVTVYGFKQILRLFTTDHD